MARSGSTRSGAGSHRPGRGKESRELLDSFRNSSTRSGAAQLAPEQLNSLRSSSTRSGGTHPPGRTRRACCVMPALCVVELHVEAHKRAGHAGHGVHRLADLVARVREGSDFVRAVLGPPARRRWWATAAGSRMGGGGDQPEGPADRALFHAAGSIAWTSRARTIPSRASRGRTSARYSTGFTSARWQLPRIE